MLIRMNKHFFCGVIKGYHRAIYSNLRFNNGKTNFSLALTLSHSLSQTGDRITMNKETRNSNFNVLHSGPDQSILYNFVFTSLRFDCYLNRSVNEICLL